MLLMIQILHDFVYKTPRNSGNVVDYSAMQDFGHQQSEERQDPDHGDPWVLFERLCSCGTLWLRLTVSMEEDAPAAASSRQTISQRVGIQIATRDQFWMI